MGHELDTGIKKYYTVSPPPKMEDAYDGEDLSAEEKEAITIIIERGHSAPYTKAQLGVLGEMLITKIIY
jgi:hypothetical protein